MALFVSTTRLAGKRSGQAMLTGPWKGGRGAGRARRGPSVIVVSKKRVRVPNFRYPEIVAQIG